MFSGIVEEVGVIRKIEKRSSFWSLGIEAKKLAASLQKSDSLAVDGVCLTITKKSGRLLWAEAIKPTLEITTLGFLKIGSLVNLERAVGVDKRFDGHFVLGHVDAKLKILALEKKGSYYILEAELPKSYRKLLVEKGSVALAGISLTVAQLKEKSFCVNVIPYTFAHTSLAAKRKGNLINAEFDYLAKVIISHLERRNSKFAR